MSQNRAPNMQAVLDWVKKNRPDTLKTFEELIDTNDPGGRGDAMLFLVAVGVSAGRQYQADHPELDPRSYHTDHSPETIKTTVADRLAGLTKLVRKALKHGTIVNPQHAQELRDFLKA